MSEALSSKTILKKFSDIFKKTKKNMDVNEAKIRRYFYDSKILELLGYKEEDIYVKETVEKGETDIHCVDDFGNVTLVVELKKPKVKPIKYESQLWQRYMKPLKAEYGILFNGLELIFYKRAGNDLKRIFKINLNKLDEDRAKTLIKHLKKPERVTTNIDLVLEYLEKFRESSEKLELKKEAARDHFFQNFRLKEDSIFGNLLRRTINLYEELKGRVEFLDSAYSFWRKSYAKKPDEIPDDWEPLMEEAGLESKEEDLYKFMFCLETTYALFTRTILAKSGEDYGFPDIRFADFIESEIKKASHRGDIAQGSWAKMLKDLISNMKTKLVSSVFEEDIFYWWTEPFKERAHSDFFSSRTTRDMNAFGEALAKVLLTLYKFDFSKIEGDPLGVLYQKYFDKETRKALGEFYTPQEVVDYILDAVGYKGRRVWNKRLLDPACGSGTFLVTALKRYLKASKEIADKRGWDYVLNDLCNKYRIVGFDIHPFATIMAQIQFMLVLLPYYKKAIEDDRYFVLQRVPMFRTDSLKKESESGELKLDDYEKGKKIGMKIELPTKGEEGFFKEKFEMPHVKTVLSETDIHNNEEYFGALQGLFDVIKEQARDMDELNEAPVLDKKKFERILKKYYLSDKNWTVLSGFFEPFANDLLKKIYRLQTEFDDGRLVKSIEDVFLAALLKNEQKYDFIIENPPYVRIHNLSKRQKDYYKRMYKTAYGQYDLYILFMERSIELLKEEGKFGLIVSSKFTSSNYGIKLREYLLNKTKIMETIDVSSLDMFKDASIYPFICVFEKESSEKIRKDNKIKTSINPTKEEFLSRNMDCYFVPQSRYLDNQDFLFDLLPEDKFKIIEKLNRDSIELGEITDITRGFRPPPEHLKFKTNSRDREPYIRGEEMKGPYEIQEPNKFVEYHQKEIAESKPPEVFEKPKIMVRDIGLSASSYYDEEGVYCLKTIYLIRNLKHEHWSLKLLTGLLNSKVIDFFFRAKFWSSHIGGGYLRFRKQYLRQIPIPVNPDKLNLEKLEQVIKEIKRVLEKKRKIRNFPNLSSGREVSKKIVTFKAGHLNVSPSIQKTQDGMHGVVIGKRKKEDPILVDTEEKALFIKKALEGKSVRKGEKIEILVPRSNEVVKEILEEYRNDKEKLKEMPTVEELEGEINEIVYDLYDLNEEDIEVIEDFLEKF